jgi:hypothetical protein
MGSASEKKWQIVAKTCAASHVEPRTAVRGSISNVKIPKIFIHFLTKSDLIAPRTTLGHPHEATFVGLRWG